MHLWDRARGRAGRTGRGAGLGAPLLVTAAILVLAAPARASFHLIKVREVYPGAADDSYVELQMYASGQGLLGGHAMTLYGAGGALVHSSTFASSVPNSANQQTILIGDTRVAEAFGVTPDLTDASLGIPASGGAVCWNAGGAPADCVAWGNFSGGGAFQTATGTGVGTPVSPGGVTGGKAIRRTIEPGCPTLLEESDDTDDSAVDFAEVAPAPRNDASAIVEHTCAGAPETAIDEKPPLRSNSTSAEFTYDAPTATSYECRLDAAAFSACPAGGPQQYTGLPDGSHTFQVRGVNSSGPDPTPASYTWTVDTVAPLTTIDTHPSDPSPGATAQFTYHAPNEPGSTFRCSLDGASPSACASTGIAYHGLADGIHTFAVTATDGAGNQQLSPTEFSWTVDNSLADTTPPDTTIGSRPPDPSVSSTAAFTYASNEPGSTFECALDDSPFAPCPTSGVAYGGLAGGLHTFRVRAVDPSDNVDPTPAGYSFTVVLAAEAASLPAPPQAAPDPRRVPQTRFRGAPPRRTRDRTPTFRFSASPPTAGFQCRLDGGRYRSCRPPYTTKPLLAGRHVLRVRAVSAGGATDPTPATIVFRVVKS